MPSQLRKHPSGIMGLWRKYKGPPTQASLFAISSRRANKEHAHSPRFRPSLRGCIRDLDSVRRSGAADIALLDKGERSGSPPKTEKGDQ